MAEHGEIIVSSKAFRTFLKLVRDAYQNQVEVTFILAHKELTVYSLKLPIEGRGLESGEYEITSGSLNRMIKILKYASDQPIVVSFEDCWNCFNLKSCHF